MITCYNIICEDDLFYVITAKAKIDVVRKSRYVTRGGPGPPPLTAAEEAMIQSLGGGRAPTHPWVW